MNFDEELFKKFIAAAEPAGGASAGAADKSVLSWLNQSELPVELKAFLSGNSPKTELWAGAGAIFEEKAIVKWNDDFPAPVKSGLLIIGSAANGDHIVLDFLEGHGAVGYLNHEQDVSVCEPRDFFVPVAKSIGEFLTEINDEDATLPEDYFEAVERLKITH